MSRYTGNGHVKTVAGGSLKGFLARYFPVFMGTILLACFSGSTLLVLVGMTYWRTLEPSVRTDYVGLGTLALVLVVGNFLMARGRVWAVCSGLLSGLSGYGNFNVCLPAASRRLFVRDAAAAVGIAVTQQQTPP